MKSGKSFAAGVVLSIFMAISTSAGDMPGPGVVQQPPKTESETVPAPVNQPSTPCAGQTSTGTCEATTDPLDEAMIIAILLLISFG